ncbi:hypothetical protein SCA6_007157 [Theobroma cacao]
MVVLRVDTHIWYRVSCFFKNNIQILSNPLQMATVTLINILFDVIHVANYIHQKDHVLYN